MSMEIFKLPYLLLQYLLTYLLNRPYQILLKHLKFVILIKDFSLSTFFISSPRVNESCTENGHYIIFAI